MKIEKTWKRILSLLAVLVLLFTMLPMPHVHAANLSGGEKLYLKPNSNWTNDNARFAIYVFNGSGDAWASMEGPNRDGIYEATVPSGNWTNVIFVRMDSSNTNNTWDTDWNQTSDLEYNGTDNLYTVADGAWSNGSGIWSTYEAPAAMTVTIHFQNTEGWESVNGYAWNTNNGAKIYTDAWPGTTTVENANDGWYTMTLTNVRSVNLGVIFNNGSGSQTSNIFITNAVDGGEYWCTVDGLKTKPDNWNLIASGECGDGVSWELGLNGVLTISGTGPMTNYGSSDALPWEDYKGSIKAVVVAEGVTSIGSYAFKDCYYVQSVKISSTVTEIGKNAFQSCVGLTAVYFHNSGSLTSIGNSAFSNTGLTSVSIPAGVTTIGAGSFDSNAELTSVTIPAGVQTIKSGAFDLCENLSAVNVPCSWEDNPLYTFAESVTVTVADHDYENDVCKACGKSTSVAPAVPDAVIQGLEGNGWYKTAMLVPPAGYEIAAAEDGEYSASGLNIPQGNYETTPFSYVLKDEAGNVTAKTVTVKVDGGAPVIAEPQIELNDEGDIATVTVAATDATSGVASYALTNGDGLTFSAFSGDATGGSFTVTGMDWNNTYTLTLTVTDNAGNTATKEFTLVRACSHTSVAEDGKCENCGLQHAVKVTAGAVTAYCVDFDQTVTYIGNLSGSDTVYVTLLDSTSGSNATTIPARTVVLDLNGKTLEVGNLRYASGADVTLRGTNGGELIVVSHYVDYGVKLTMESGKLLCTKDYQSTVYVYGTFVMNGGEVSATGSSAFAIDVQGDSPVLRITGGTISSEQSMALANRSEYSSDIKISGGTFIGGIWSGLDVMTDVYVYLKDLMAESYKLVHEDGSDVDMEEGIVDETVSVVCGHSTTKQEDNGNGTHKVVCANTACNDVVTESENHTFSSATGKCGCGVACPHGSYTDGECDNCGYGCTHSGHTMVYIDENNHGFTCTTCGAVVTEAHTMNADTGKCDCGVQVSVASVTAGDTTTYFETLAAAVGTAQGSSGSTVKLLKAIALDSKLKITSGEFTLDLNGETLSAKETIVVTGGKLTITDSKTGGKLAMTNEDDILKIERGEVILEKGTLTSALHGIYVETFGSFTMKGGSITAADTGVILDGGTATLLGGTVQGHSGCAVYNNGGEVTLGNVDGGPTLQTSGSLAVENTNGGTVHVYQATVTAEYYGFIISGSDSKVNLYGKPIINSSTADWDLDGGALHIYTDLSDTVYKVTREGGGVFAVLEENGKAEATCFISVTDGYQVTKADKELSLSAVRYTITYDLDGGYLTGDESNPATYDVTSGTFTLRNPYKVGYAFTGWTGTGLSEKTDFVKIEHGSYGNREYKANWEVCPHNTIAENGEGKMICARCYIQIEATVTDQNDVTTNFSTLQGAIDAAEALENSTVKVLKDVTLTQDLTIDSGTFTLDLNGKTVSNAATTLTVTGGTVTIKSTENGGTLSMTGSTGDALRITGGKVILSGIVVSSEGVGVCLQDNAGFEMTGGNISAKGTAVLTEGQAVIAQLVSGNIYSEGSAAVYNDGSSLYIGGTGGDLTIQAPNGIGIQAGGATYVDKVNITAKTYGIEIFGNHGSVALEGVPTIASEIADFCTSNNMITIGVDLGSANYTVKRSGGLFAETQADDITVSAQWFTSVEEGYVVIASTSKKLVLSPIAYTISYDLAGGSLAEGESNPTDYDVKTDSITLKNPTRKGYIFVGWTGTGLDAATVEVTIAKGSTGNRSYTATWQQCTHSNSAHTTGTDNGNGTHDFACTVCGETGTEACSGGMETCVQGKLCGICGDEYTQVNPANHVKTTYTNGFRDCCGEYQAAVLNTDGVYEISNAGQLYWFAAVVNSGYGATEKNQAANAKLTADITIPKTVGQGGTVPDWTPIEEYAGTFDGAGKAVSGLYFNNANTSFVGFVGSLYGGTVKNLTVKDSYICGNNRVGGIVGYNKGTVTGCFSSATVKASSDVGGIVGRNYQGTVTSCFSSATVTAGGRAGGIVGDNSSGLVERCGNSGTVTAGGDAGGIAGCNANLYDDPNSAIIRNCYNTGSVSGQEAGGIVGYQYEKYGSSSKVQNCWSAGSVTGTNDAGGLAGYVTGGSIDTSYYDSTVFQGETIGEYKNASINKIGGMSTAQFASGAVAYLLNGSVSGGETWKQDLGTDTYPTFTGGKVYYGYLSCANNAQKVYTNDSTAAAAKPGHTPDENSYASTGDEQHSFSCVVCGETFTENHTLDYENLEVAGHRVFCENCDYEKQAGHNLNSTTGQCAQCQKNMAVASATVSGSTTYYQTLGEAINAVKSTAASDNAVVKLLADVELSKTQYITSGIFTLDLNGHSVVCSTAAFKVQSAALTVISSVSGGTIQAAEVCLFADQGGEITAADIKVICTGDNNSAIAANQGTVKLTNVTVEASGVGVSASHGGTAEITGGSIRGEKRDVNSLRATMILHEGVSFPGGLTTSPYSNYGPLKEMLADGMAYWQGDTMLILADNTREITGSDVTVKAECKHTTGTVGYTDNGDGTHNKTWSCCNATIVENHSFTVTAGECDACDYVCDHAEHTQNGCACGITDSSIHTSFKYRDNGSGTHSEVCKVCDYVASTHPHSYGDDHLCVCEKSEDFTVSLGSGIFYVTIDYSEKATFNTDYTATITPDQYYYIAENHWVTIGGEDYTGYTLVDGVLTIPGADITGEIVIYARGYRIPAKITWDYNGGSVFSSNPYGDYEQTQSGANTYLGYTVDTAVCVSLRKLTRPGYVLTGWNTVKEPTEENPGEAYAKDESIFMNQETKVVYAQWTKIDLSAEKGSYNGQPHTTTVTIEGMTEGVDFEVTYPADMTNVGEKVITVTELDEYGSTTTVIYTVEARDISDAVVTIEDDLVYNGQSQTAKVTKVQLRDMILTEGTDYTLSGNTAASSGEYELTITGTGNFTGSVKAEWKITKRLASVIAKNQSITYGETISAAEYTVTGLTEGHSAVVTLTPSTDKVTANGTITASGAKITSGDADVTANYDISYVPGKLVIAPVTSKIDDLTTENVTSEDEEKLEEVLEQLENADSLTEEWEALAEDVQDMLDRIGEATGAADTQSIQKVQGVTAENVREEDQEALEDAASELKNAQQNYGGNYTDEEKQTIQADMDRIDDALQAIENAEAVEEAIGKLPETVVPDDGEVAIKILAAQDAYDALTDHEKTLVDEEAKQKLDALVEALTAYRFVAGSGGTYTKESGETLSFTANGSYGKFTGVEVDGKKLDSSCYTAKSGSTIITLKTAYLETLAVGKHTITAVYTDGKAEGDFTVEAAETVPPTTEDEETVPPTTEDEETVPPTTEDEETVPPTTEDEETAPPTTEDKPVVTPPTGDGFQPMLWVAVMTISFGLVVLLEERKRLQK